MEILQILLSLTKFHAIYPHKPQLHKLPIRVDTEEGMAECVVEISRQKLLKTIARPEQE